MADGFQKKPFKWSNIASQGGSAARLLLKVWASSRLFWMLLLATVVGGGWLVYTQVWLPLQQEVQLPASVPDRNPMINRELLQELSEGLTIRRRHTPASYFEVASALAPLPPGQAPLEEEGDGGSNQQ